MTIPTSNLACLLRQTARRFPARAALIRGDDVFTWEALAARVAAAADGLAALGVGPGERVLVFARNCPALFESAWAAWTLGAVWVPLNVRLSPHEVAQLAAAACAKVHVFDSGFPDHVTAAEAANPHLSARIVIGSGALTWDTLARARPSAERPLTEVGRDDPCWLFYTSGTSGQPKAAMLTHGQMAFVVTSHLCDLMPGTTEHDVSLAVAPLSHGAGVHALAQVARGAATVLTESDRLDPAEVWRLVERHRVTNMFTVPTILTALARHEAVQRHDHRSLRYVIYAGAPLYRADQAYALRTLGQVLVQYYGLGEVTGNITVLPPHLHGASDDPDLPHGSCGVPRTGMDVAILDVNGAMLPTGETGEICVRGPAVFAGYFENPDASAEAFRHGWFHTGDLGHLNARGFLFITGRRSDMFISGGSNIYPRDVEEALLQHPDVAEACVVGLPHPKWGEAGAAVLVAREGATLDPMAVLATLEGRLARYKWPVRVEVWPDLPKSGYGKVPKAEIRQRLLDGSGSA